eukprot:TRINITY_DN22929_c0_g1_i1.p1 TRINITY_DN22929_c0_g1~~TRINITY_DN22929_c0_g1_i1.p1  ORF type:complete len:119 (-),score=22.75 TRINITY_DN22929_c0_g1_i1:8-364(-)
MEGKNSFEIKILKSSSTTSSQMIQNPKSKFEFQKVVIPYMNSEQPFCYIKLPTNYFKAGFGLYPNQIIILTKEKNYYLCTFDPINQKEAIQQKETRKLWEDQQEDSSHIYVKESQIKQ